MVFRGYHCIRKCDFFQKLLKFYITKRFTHKTSENMITLDNSNDNNNFDTVNDMEVNI